MDASAELVGCASCRSRRWLQNLPERLQRTLNVIDADGHIITYDQVGHRRPRLNKLLRRKALGLDPATHLTPATELMNAMIQATLTEQDRESRTLGLDGTISAAWEHPDRARVDPETGEKLTDAALGHGTTKRHNTKYRFGYEAEMVTTIEPGLRKLVRAFTVHANDTGHRIRVLPVLEYLARLGQLSRIVHDAGYDRADPELLTMPLHRAGVERIFDPLVHQRRHVHDIDGAAILDGQPHCPCTPPKLQDLPKVTGTNRDDLVPRYETRDLYRLQPFGTTKAGTPRYECPARAGKVRCPNVPRSFDLPATNPTIDTRPIDGYPDRKVCTQSAISIPVEVLIRDRQGVPYGTAKWEQIYRHRTKTETVNSTIKHSVMSLGVGSIRSVGIEMQTIATGIAAVATNILTRRNHEAVEAHEHRT